MKKNRYFPILKSFAVLVLYWAFIYFLTSLHFNEKKKCLFTYLKSTHLQFKHNNYNYIRDPQLKTHISVKMPYKIKIINIMLVNFLEIGLYIKGNEVFMPDNLSTI